MDGPYHSSVTKRGLISNVVQAGADPGGGRGLPPGVANVYEFVFPDDIPDAAPEAPPVYPV